MGRGGGQLEKMGNYKMHMDATEIIYCRHLPRAIKPEEAREKAKKIDLSKDKLHPK